GWYNQRLTDSVFLLPQSLYYQLADAPLNCFGLGWGKGCLYEHGDVVREQGGQGLTTFWMLKNTQHRLQWLSLDIAQLELLSIGALLGVFWLPKRSWRRLALLNISLLVAAYSLFYFAGSYPGAGARFLSETLPIFHVGLAQFNQRTRSFLFLFGLALCGFALHGSYAHEALRSREQAHFDRGTAATKEPRFSSSEVDFHLNFNPDDQPPKVLFHSHDARELPYVQKPEGQDEIEEKILKQLSEEEKNILVPTEARLLHFELEAAWPLIAQEDASSYPSWHPASCLSGGRGLRVLKEGPKPKIRGFFVSASSEISEEYFVRFLNRKGECALMPWSELGLFRGSSQLNSASMNALFQHLGTREVLLDAIIVRRGAPGPHELNGKD
ncbi:MAG: hypothetical protein MK135_06745, partial [Polyangiaceae bacterium]|nr:hypothetical protein [Polyangiaceae bacterium]